MAPGRVAGAVEHVGLRVEPLGKGDKALDLVLDDKRVGTASFIPLSKRVFIVLSETEWIPLRRQRSHEFPGDVIGGTLRTPDRLATEGMKSTRRAHGGVSSDGRTRSNAWSWMNVVTGKERRRQAGG